MSYPSDEELYGRFLKTGDPDGIEQLLERHREGLSLFIYGIVGNMEDAEDLMLDTFAVVVSRRSAFRGMSSFKTWLFGIARNQAGTFLRRQRRMVFVPDEPQFDNRAGTENSTELAFIQKEEKQQLYRALETLPEDYRQVLYLLYFEEMSREEACAVMKKTKKQLYHLAERGRKALKDALERMGVDDAKYR